MNIPVYDAMRVQEGNTEKHLSEDSFYHPPGKY